MIVVCATCHARFKVADEKIGPRGAKVRCSKCQTVFMVHKELGVVPMEQPPAAQPPAPRRKVELDLESEPMGGVRPSGLIADPFSRGADPFSIPSAPAPQPAPAPAPSAGLDPFASAPAAPPAPAEAAEQDPFASAPPAQEPYSAADPFAASTGSAGPFGAVDPFVATVAGSEPAVSAAVTDLSDLLGPSASAAGPAPAHAPEVAQPAPAATPAPEPSGILETGFDFDTSAAPGLGAADSPGPELEAAPSTPPFPSDAPPGAEPDLALAERTPSPGMPVHGAAPASMPGFGDFAGADPFDGQGGLDLGGGAAPALAGEEDAFGGAHDLQPPAPPPAPAPAPEAAAPAAVAAAALGPEEEAAEGLRHRSSRLRTLLVNAVSLAALVVVAMAFLAYWRGVRPGSGGSGPRALLGMLSTQARQPFGASQIRSGLYERSDAAPVLFVSGNAVSHVAAAVEGLRVRVELVRKGAVLARGEARAGAVPTPEELYQARDAAALAAVLERLDAKAPATVKPGEPVPFLVAFADYPADITGIGLRVTVEPIGKGAPEKGERRP